MHHVFSYPDLLISGYWFIGKQSALLHNTCQLQAANLISIRQGES